jgi:dienelactone hydrolase
MNAARAPVLLAVALLAGGCAPGARAAVAGSWIGSYRLPATAAPVAISIELRAGRATVSLGPGHAGATSVRASVRGTRLRLSLPGRPARLVFAGVLRRRALAGSVAQGPLRGCSRAVRGAAGVLPLLGLYRRGSDAVAVVRAAGFAPWLLALPSGDVHGLGPSLSVGPRLGETAGAGSLRTRPGRLTWTRGASTAAYARVPLRQQEVRVGSLAGTLTLPPGPGPFPAVAWVHGSGFRGRDEAQVFAYYLALRGVAVLAYDKRGVGESAGNYPGEQASQATLDVLSRDAAAAARFLAAQPEVDRGRVGLVGDSQAGWIIALAAAREPAVRWAIALAGPTVSVGQTDLWASLAGKGEGPPSEPYDRIEAEVRAAGPSGFDPAASLAGLSIPVLWVYGDDDRNVPTKLCLERLELLRPGHDFSWVVLHTTHTLLDLPSGLNADVPRSDGFARGLFAALDGWLRARHIASDH